MFYVCFVWVFFLFHGEGERGEFSVSQFFVDLLSVCIQDKNLDSGFKSMTLMSHC